MFSFFELSRFLGRKIALYDFNREGVHLRFNSTDRDITLGGHTWLAARGITHSAVRESSSSATKNQLTISAPYLLDGSAAEYPATQVLGNWWRPFPPSQRVLVSVMSTHLGDPDEEIVTDWKGRVVGPTYTPTQVKLTCDPSYRSGRMSGSIPRIQRGCGVALYSQGLGMCNLDPEPLAVDATLIAVSGLTLTAAEFGTSAHPLGGGLIKWVRGDGLVETRSITAHNGNDIRILYGATDLATDLVVRVYFGCAHNLAACTALGNEINYPGFPNLPTEDVMARSQAW